MSYETSRYRSRTNAIARRRGLGDDDDTTINGVTIPGDDGTVTIGGTSFSSDGTATNIDCASQAASTVQPFDAQIAQLTSTMPMGPYYGATQMSQLIGLVMAMNNQVANTIMQTQALDDTAQLDAANNALVGIGQRSIGYLTSVNQALNTKIATLQSSDFRQWVLDAMQANRNGMYAVSYAACDQPWFLSSLASFQSAFDQVMGIAQTFGAAAITVGSAVLQIPSQAIGAAKLLFYGGIAAVGAYLLYELLVVP